MLTLLQIKTQGNHFLVMFLSCMVQLLHGAQHTNLSTAVAEFIVLTEAVKESIWVKGILEEFAIFQEQVTIFCDNQSAIHLSKHQGYHERNKHIDVKLYFLRDMIEKGVIVVRNLDTAENPADCFTKDVPSGKFELFLNLIKLQ